MSSLRRLASFATITLALACDSTVGTGGSAGSGGMGGTGGTAGAGGTAGGGGMPPPMGGMGGMMMGPKPCTTQADCTDACGPEAQGCTCTSTPMGEMVCVPTCTTTADCPTPPNGMQLECMNGVCVPSMP